ncbi:MAG: nucleotidyltransferase domain-containing protein [Phycisphaerae bacterium]
MPVRSLSSSVLRWPDPRTVIAAARQWARRLADCAPDVLAVGCFGSYARGDAGVGSDLDLVVIVDRERGAIDPSDEAWATEHLPVPVERLVYTARQWAKLRESDSRFYRVLLREARWLVGAPPDPTQPTGEGG